jgi:predicted regulator of Ras-like GTPase activity (Roadblock/LC7/MglB family)
MTGRALNLTADCSRNLRSSLARLCHESDARYAAIVQDSGFVVADEGEASYHDLGETGALATGTFFAARALARRLGEANFAGLHYEGSDRHFLLAPIGDDCLLLVVFTDQTRPAIVRACVRKVLPSLTAAVAALGESAPSTTRQPLVPAEFDTAWSAPDARHSGPRLWVA